MQHGTDVRALARLLPEASQLKNGGIAPGLRKKNKRPAMFKGAA
jgi:hypothetical protein